MFESIVGQEQALDVLRSMLTHGNIPHTLLFTGPDGVGKTDTALEFARRLLCENPGDPSCDTCNACRRAAKLEHPDIHLLFPTRARPAGGDALDKWVDAVGEVRALFAGDPYAPKYFDRDMGIVVGLADEVHDRLMATSLEGGRRVCVIIGADRLNKATSNSFLKILEEPPPGVHFVMTAERLSSVLPTVVSRSSILKFRRLRHDEIERYLERRGFGDGDSRRNAAHFAEGSIKAARLFLETDRSDEYARIETLYLKIALGGRDDIADETSLFIRSRDKLGAEEILYGFSRATRRVLFRFAGGEESAATPFDTLAGRTSLRAIERLGARIEDAIDMIGRNVNIATVFASLFYEIQDAYGTR